MLLCKQPVEMGGLVTLAGNVRVLHYAEPKSLDMM